MRAPVLLLLVGCGRDVYPVAVDDTAAIMAPAVDDAIAAWRKRGVDFVRDDSASLRFVVLDGVAELYGDDRTCQCGPFDQIQCDPRVEGLDDAARERFAEHELGHAHGLVHHERAGVMNLNPTAWSADDDLDLEDAEMRARFTGLYGGMCP